MEKRTGARGGETALSPQRKSGTGLRGEGGGSWGNHGFPHAKNHGFRHA